MFVGLFSGGCGFCGLLETRMNGLEERGGDRDERRGVE